MQAVIGSSKFSFSFYIVGILIFFGVLLGRAVCGFLCPFGWFQELLHKIPGKKFSTRRLRPLTHLKYVILALFVIVLPMTVVNEVGMGDPWSCKWLCPLGACGHEGIEVTKTPFPSFEGVDLDGNAVSNEIFSQYDATIVNFWTNGCGSCRHGPHGLGRSARCRQWS